VTHLQFRDALAALGLSQVDAAKLLGVDPRTVRRWVSGDRDVPPPVARFLQYLMLTGRSGAYAIASLARLAPAA
jgi:transcriptional regulator with XRE-family HTH domain